MDTEPTAPIALALGQIVVDPRLQPRVEGVDPEHVRTLEPVAEHWPPLKVIKQNGRYLLVDGFHRLAAAQNLKLSAIPVVVLDVPAREDLHALAFALNAAHGRPLTLSDRRAFAARLLREHPDWSDREIGRKCGLVQPTIAKVRQDLERQAQIQPVETRIGRDGRAYAATPKPTPCGLSLGQVIENLADVFTPAERRAQRRVVRYLEQLLDVFDQQDGLPGFDTVDQAAEACRAVLGTMAAQELGARLGLPAGKILEIARDLGYRGEQA